jgi:hypothetical protein
MKITRSDGSVEVDRASDLFESRAKKILADARLQEIAEAIAGAISWQRLRVVFEKLSTLVGSGDNQLVSQGYATQAELTRFKANIEDPRLSGLNAVHGVPRGPLKGTPLSLAEGLGFVTKLINDYLDRN